MRRIAVLLLDLILVGFATILALAIRDNLELSDDKLWATVPYLVHTLVAALIVLPLLGLPQRIWRFSSLGDYVRLTLSSILIVVAAVAATFAFNRLDGVARTLPFLQLNVMVFMLVGARVLRRLQHQTRPVKAAPQTVLATSESVLLVGLTRLADLYARSVAEFAPHRVRIAGVLDHKQHHHGGAVQHFPILGAPEDIDRIVRDLTVHGVTISRVVVARPLSALSPIAQQAILQLEASSDIRIDFLAERLGLDEEPVTTNASVAAQRFVFSAEDVARLQARPFWRIKRVMDFMLAAAAIVIAAPIMLVTALLVAIDVGWPLYFWQQRPGKQGVPFHVYKFRTMRAAHDKHGHLIAEHARVSLIGTVIRRTRIDELPQLFSILRGDMSFVGPRPLLPRDQPAQYAARLLVPPGLTGWAQVNGGRDVSAADKAALDVWYVRNASLLLDVRILFRTIPMVLFGERLRQLDIARAWQDLRRDGVATHAPAVALPDATLLPNRRAA